jgi:hypothetical protein
VFITVCVWTSHTRMIYTPRVRCWHAWVWLWHSRKLSWHSRKWLWHSYVSKPAFACRYLFCVWCSLAYCDEHTHESNFGTQSVISTRTVWFINAQCDFYTQSVISTRKVWLLHAECNLQTQCDFDTQKCNNDTYNCDFNTQNSDFYTQSVMLTRMSVIMTLCV